MSDFMGVPNNITRERFRTKSFKKDLFYAITANSCFKNIAELGFRKEIVKKYRKSLDKYEKYEKWRCVRDIITISLIISLTS
jgi:hypothetical protein